MSRIPNCSSRFSRTLTKLHTRHYHKSPLIKLNTFPARHSFSPRMAPCSLWIRTRALMRMRPIWNWKPDALNKRFCVDGMGTSFGGISLALHSRRIKFIFYLFKTITSFVGEFIWNRAASPQLYALTWNGLMELRLGADTCPDVNVNWEVFGGTVQLMPNYSIILWN